MKAFDVEIARVVISKAGHDAGRRYVVIAEIDEDFVMVADGYYRSLSRPKKKRRKHIKPTEWFSEELKQKFLSGAAVDDCEVRCLLKEEGK